MSQIIGAKPLPDALESIQQLAKALEAGMPPYVHVDERGFQPPEGWKANLEVGGADVSDPEIIATFDATSLEQR